MLLSSRERIFVLLGAVACLVFALYLGVESFFNDINKTKKLAQTRQIQLEQIALLVQRYNTLESRLQRLQETFSESQLTFEQVTKQLDSIVRQSIGSDKYGLDRGRSLTQIGESYQKQEFTLKISSITLEQVVDLLYRLEHGESPLLLGKVDLVHSRRNKSFSATLEIFSVLKMQT